MEMNEVVYEFIIFYFSGNDNRLTTLSMQVLRFNNFFFEFFFVCISYTLNYIKVLYQLKILSLSTVQWPTFQ